MSEGSVRVLYVVPADKEFRADYSAGISKAIVDVQSWYRRQLDGLTFDIYSVIPEPCHLPEDEDYYSYTDVWEKGIEGCPALRAGAERYTLAVHLGALRGRGGSL